MTLTSTSGDASEPNKTSASVDAPVPTRAQGRGLPEFHVADLMGQGREAIINHDGQSYRLRITSNQKLILTK